MIVVDASAMVEALVGKEIDDRLLALLEGEISAPHLLDAEVLSVLRGLTLRGTLPEEHADRARHNYFALNIVRYDSAPLAERVWALRHNYTSYNAHYIALSEALPAPLGTCDRKLAGNGHRAVVDVFPRSHPTGP